MIHIVNPSSVVIISLFPAHGQFISNAFRKIRGFGHTEKNQLKYEFLRR